MYVVVYVTVCHVLVSLPKIPTYIGNARICMKGRIRIDGFWEQDAAENAEAYEGAGGRGTDAMTSHRAS